MTYVETCHVCGLGIMEGAASVPAEGRRAGRHAHAECDAHQRRKSARSEFAGRLAKALWIGVGIASGLLLTVTLIAWLVAGAP